jgi:hypothetical protein
MPNSESKSQNIVSLPVINQRVLYSAIRQGTIYLAAAKEHASLPTATLETNLLYQACYHKLLVLSNYATYLLYLKGTVRSKPLGCEDITIKELKEALELFNTSSLLTDQAH